MKLETEFEKESRMSNRQKLAFGANFGANRGLTGMGSSRIFGNASHASKPYSYLNLDLVEREEQESLDETKDKL